MRVPVQTILLDLPRGWWIGTTEYRIGPDRPMSRQMKEFCDSMAAVSRALRKGMGNIDG